MRSISIISLLMLVVGGLYGQHTVSGRVFNDPDGGDLTNSAAPFSLPQDPLIAVLIRTSDNTIFRTDFVEPDGTFSFVDVSSGDYFAMLITSNVVLPFGDPIPAPILETSWTRTGESLDPVGGVADGTIDGRTEVFSVSGSSDMIRFGIQERPFAYNKLNVQVDNTASGAVDLAVNTGSVFTQGGASIMEGIDNGGGTIEGYGISVLPQYGDLFLGAVQVTDISQVASLTPAQILTLAYSPDATKGVLSHEQDYFTYYATDNAGARSDNATYVIPFQLLDSDGDTIADRDDLDDDNDGITDVEECELNVFSNLFTAYTSGDFRFIRPSHLGLPAGYDTGINITADVSSLFGSPSGAVVVTITNGNTHPTADEFFVNDETGPTQWTISGTLGAYTVITHGQEFFSYDTRTITLLNGTPKQIVLFNEQGNNIPSQSGWEPGTDNTYHWWLTNNNPRTYPDPSLGLLGIGLIDPEPKYFQVASTANNLDEWATYFVEILPECDYDNDGIPNRLDLDSDNDGCPDALEGSAGLDYDDLGEAGGTVSVGEGSTAPASNLCASRDCVDDDGIPLIVSGSNGQNPVATYDENVMSQVCIEAMPVSLIRFELAKSENQIVLSWATAEELNNRGFQIESSSDARNWRSLGFVESKKQAGSTNRRIDYQFVDEAPVSGQNYYRLKQVDLDGTYEYSSILSARIDAKSQIVLHPNPTSSKLLIKGLTGGEHVAIFDMLGRVIYQRKAAESGKFELPVGNWGVGTYHVQVSDTQGRRTMHRFVVVK